MSTSTIETFPNPRPEREFEIAIDCPEFTCLCPKTGQPDFGTITIAFEPDELCLESKSLKLYLWGYRDKGAFCEALADQIARDIYDAIRPWNITVTNEQNIRGGIGTVSTATIHRNLTTAKEAS